MRLLRAILASVALFCAPALLAAPGATAEAAELKVATVDLQRAINEVKAGEKEKARLEGMMSSKRANLEKMEAQLVKMQEDYQKQAMVLSESARAAKEQELGQAQMNFQQTYMMAEQEMQAAYGQSMEALIEKMRPVCSQIAAERGISLVLEKNTGVVWGADALDITNELIKRFNAMHGG